MSSHAPPRHKGRSHQTTDRGERKELLGVDLFEITLTAAPANPDTRVLSTKSADAELDDGLTAADVAAMTTDELREQFEHAGVDLRPPVHVKSYPC